MKLSRLRPAGAFDVVLPILAVFLALFVTRQLHDAGLIPDVLLELIGALTGCFIAWFWHVLTTPDDEVRRRSG